MMNSNPMRSLAFVCIAGSMLAQLAGAAEPENRMKFDDVALAGNGRLIGKVVNRQGDVLPGREVKVMFQKNVVARAVSDRNGRFEIRQLKAGVHSIVTSDSTNLCRLWTAKAAPPSATNQLVLVSGASPVRGQYPADSYGGFDLFGSGTMISGSAAIGATLGAIWGFNHGLDNESVRPGVNSSNLTPASP